jgi:hypothetical protein
MEAMKLLFHTESGFSIVQGMILAGVLAGTSLVATRMLADQKHALKGAITRDQIEQLHSTIFAVLQNPDNCTASVKGLAGLRPGESNPNLDISDDLVDIKNSPEMRTIVSVTRLNASTTATVYDQAKNLFGTPYGTEFPTYMNGNILIRSMRWIYPVLNGIPTVINPNPGPPGDGVAHLEIDYERLNDDPTLRLKSGYGAKNIKKTIVVRIQRKRPVVAPAFVSCYAVVNPSVVETGDSDVGTLDLSAEICESLNSTGTRNATASLFTWDESTSNCYQKQRTCASDEIFTGIDSNGRTMCRKIQDWIQIEDFIDSTTYGACLGNMYVKFQQTGNKVRIKCNFTP